VYGRICALDGGPHYIFGIGPVTMSECFTKDLDRHLRCNVAGLGAANTIGDSEYAVTVGL
jgi:hypothetical protein